MILIFGALANHGDHFVCTLSGETVSQGDGLAPYDTTVAIKFLADGTVEADGKANSAALVYAQIDAATDWVIPNSAAGGTEFTVTCTGITGTWSTDAANEDIAIDLSADRTWSITSTIEETKQVLCTFQIHHNGGLVASGAYTFTINNTS